MIEKDINEELNHEKDNFSTLNEEVDQLIFQMTEYIDLEIKLTENVTDITSLVETYLNNFLYDAAEKNPMKLEKLIAAVMVVLNKKFSFKNIDKSITYHYNPYQRVIDKKSIEYDTLLAITKNDKFQVLKNNFFHRNPSLGLFNKIKTLDTIRFYLSTSKPVASLLKLLPNLKMDCHSITHREKSYTIRSLVGLIRFGKLEFNDYLLVNLNGPIALLQIDYHDKSVITCVNPATDRAVSLFINQLSETLKENNIEHEIHHCNCNLINLTSFEVEILLLYLREKIISDKITENYESYINKLLAFIYKEFSIIQSSTSVDPLKLFIQLYVSSIQRWTHKQLHSSLKLVITDANKAMLFFPNHLNISSNDNSKLYNCGTLKYLKTDINYLRHSLLPDLISFLKQNKLQIFSPEIEVSDCIGEFVSRLNEITEDIGDHLKQLEEKVYFEEEERIGCAKANCLKKISNYLFAENGQATAKDMPKLLSRLQSYLLAFDIRSAIKIELKNKIRASLSELSVAVPNLKKELDLLIFYLDNESLYFKKMKPLVVVVELLILLLDPSRLSQDQSNLCGIASILSIMLHADVTVFIKMALIFAKEGCIEGTKIVPHVDSILNDKTIISALLAGIKHSYNKTGYSQHSFSLFESLRGATRPKQIVNILEDLGFKNMDEQTVITSLRGKELPEWYMNILGNVYSEHHKSYDILENLLRLENKLQLNQFAIMLITQELFFHIAALNINEINNGLKYLYIEYTHYVYLKNLAVNIEQNTVTVEIETYGRSFTNVIILNEFLKGYRGGITCDKTFNPHINLSRALI